MAAVNVPVSVGLWDNTTFVDPVLVVTPVPPSVTTRVPVIAEAPRSTATLELSITRPPFTFRSTATLGVELSPDPLVTVIPSPPDMD